MSRGYGWPLRPFNRQHAIRGAFGDPRFGARQRNFHFGIDIPARPTLSRFPTMSHPGFDGGFAAQPLLLKHS